MPVLFIVVVLME